MVCQCKQVKFDYLLIVLSTINYSGACAFLLKRVNKPLELNEITCVLKNKHLTFFSDRVFSPFPLVQQFLTVKPIFLHQSICAGSIFLP